MHMPFSALVGETPLGSIPAVVSLRALLHCCVNRLASNMRRACNMRRRSPCLRGVAARRLSRRILQYNFTVCTVDVRWVVPSAVVTTFTLTRSVLEDLKHTKHVLRACPRCDPRNCNTFSNELARVLLDRPVPAYINRLATLGTMVSCLLPRSITGQAPVGGGPASASGSGSSAAASTGGGTKPRPHAFTGVYKSLVSYLLSRATACPSLLHACIPHLP
jgi:hypothetical protein